MTYTTQDEIRRDHEDSRVKIICPECHGNGFHRHIGDDGLTIKQCARCKSEGEL